MSSLLANFANSAAFRAVVKSTGIPLPLPTPLRRPEGPYVERPLDEWRVLCAGVGELGAVVGRTLLNAGARPTVIDTELRKTFAPEGVAADGIAIVRDLEVLGDDRLYAIVFDATAIATPAELRRVFDTLHDALPALGSCGRVVVLTRPHLACDSAATAATRRGLEGLVRSVAKEIGRNGSTANLLIVDAGAESRVEAVLRFLLASSSAFVSAQPLHVTTTAVAPTDVPWLRPLSGKVALVTGAGRGIGETTAATLAAEGAHVVCLERPEDGQLVRAVADRIGGSALLVDVCAESAPTVIAEYLMSHHGGVDVVVHNAGVTRDKTLVRMQGDAWDTVIGVNLTAVDRITAALREGCLRDGGRVVCLSSVAGIAGNVGQANYAAAKAGLIGFVEYAAAELAPRGITVNAVAPGFIETRMTAAIPLVVREMARRLSALGQGGEAVDVAHAITFLSTPGAAGITGRVLRVCGGALVGA